MKLMLLAEEVLVYCTVRGAHPAVFEAVNPAVGGVAITTVCVEVVLPQAFVEVSATV